MLTKASFLRFCPLIPDTRVCFLSARWLCCTHLSLLSAPWPCPSLPLIFHTLGVRSGPGKEPGGCLDSSGVSLLLWLAPCCISQSPCSSVSTSWRPQTRIGLNCTQPVTSSASGRLESHKVNSFKFHPLCISFSVSSPTLPSFTSSPGKSTPPLCLPPPVSPLSFSQLYFALQEDGFIHP